MSNQEIVNLIEEIEGCYAQLILSMYTIYSHSLNIEEDNRRTKQEHRYSQDLLRIVLTPLEDDFYQIVVKLPISINMKTEKEITNRIRKLDKEYEKGFQKFMDLTDYHWYEPIRNITIYDILGIKEPFLLDESRQKFRMIAKYRKIPSFFPQEWINRYFYEYKRRLPFLYKQKKKIYEEETMKCMEKYNELHYKFNINLPSEEFHSIRNEMTQLEIRIKTSFDEYVQRPMLFNHTPNDEAVVALLKKFGYETCHVI